MNLDMLLIQLRPQAASKWYSLGLALGADKETMDKYAYSNNPDEECFVEVLDSWLRNHKGKPTWKEIAKALEDIGLHELATDLLHSYETGMYKTSRSIPLWLTIYIVCNYEPFSHTISGHLPIEVDMEAMPDIDEF